MAKKEVQVEYKVLNTQFNSGIKDITGKLSTLNKEFKLQQETMKNSASETEKLEGKLEKLNKELDLSKERTKLTADALEMAKKQTGENSKETKTWSDRLIDAKRNEEFLKNAITDVTGELNSQKSSIKELTSIEKLSIENSQRRITQLNELEKNSEELTDASDKLSKSYDLENKRVGELESKSSALTREKEYLRKQVDLTSESIMNLERQLELAKEEYGKNSEQVKKLEDALMDAKIKNQDFTNSLRDAENGLKRFGEKLESAGKVMTDTGKKMTQYVTLPIVGGVAASVKAASDFDTAFTGVKKTVDEVVDANGTVTYSYEKLEKGIRDMAKQMPSSANEIAGVAEAAGQLGIKTEDILSFTETMLMLGDSTNLSSQDAATSLARLANITGMLPKDFSRLGATIVDLGNNLATTEAEIVNMAMRLAGAGTQVGMSESEILSLAGALSSVGIEAEAGGSAFSKVMINMQLAAEKGGGSLDQFAEVAGVSSKQFAKAYKEDATEALMMFIEGLASSEEHGISAIKVLDDMDIKEVRLRDSLLRAANASGVFSEALSIGSKAWEENTALTDEARKKYETFESKVKILKNQITDIAIEFGGPLLDALSKVMEALEPTIERIADLAKKFSEASPETQKMVIKVIALTAALGPVLTVAGKFVSIIGSITKAVAVAKPAMAVMATGASGVGTAAGAAAGAGGLAGLSAGLGTVIAAAAPYALAVAGIAAAGYGVYKILNQDVIPEVDLFAEHVAYSTKTITDEYGNVTRVIEDVSVTISEETQAQVGSFFDMADSVKETFHNMYFDVNTESEAGLSDMYTKTSEMANLIIDASETQKNGVIAEYQDLFSNTTVLTSEEQMAIIKSVADGHQERITKTEDLKTRLTEIYDQIRMQGGQITLNQQQEINEIMEEMKRLSVETMSKNEAEQNVILNRLASSNERITAEMVGNTIKELEGQKEEAIRLAGEQRDDMVRQAEELRTLEGGIYADKADEIIEEANRQYEDVVKSAEETKEKGIDKLKTAYGDLTDKVDENTGEILSFWDKVKKWWDGWKPAPKNATVNTPVTPKYNNPGGTPSYTGTGYGAARQNFKGGIISDYTVLGDHSFAEKGPEAVLPLTGREMDPYADAVARRINEYNEVASSASTKPQIILNITNTLTGSADEDRLVRKIDRSLKKSSDEASFAIGGA